MPNNYRDIEYDTPFIKTINDYLNINNVQTTRHIRVQSTESGTILTKIISLFYYFNKVALNINYKGLGRTHTQHDISYLKSTHYRHVRETYDYFENIININFVKVRGNINNCFEHYLPDEFSNNDWVELNAISLALKQTPRHRIRVYLQPENKHILIFTTDVGLDYDTDYNLIKELIAITPLLLPEAWRNEHLALTTLCREILNLDADSWLTACENYLNTIEQFTNVRSERLRSDLLRLNQARKATTERSINEKRQTIDQLKERLNVELAQYRDLNATLIGVNETELTEDDINLIINKKIIENISVQNNTIHFSCTAPVLQYDKDAAKVYYKTLDHSSDFSLLFKAVFLDEQYIMHFTDCVRINYDVCNCSASANVRSHMRTVHGLPNPHHYYFNCWGSYNTVIAELISNYDHLQIFLQIKAAVGSLNMTDYTVLDRFKSDINAGHWQNMSCIFWKSDKQMHTLKETIDKLREETVNETN